MNRIKLLALYRNMLIAREIDRVEQQITSRGEAFFHLSGAGHEGTAALAEYLTPQDWLHCHYRDRALLIARGISPSARAADEPIHCRPSASTPRDEGVGRPFPGDRIRGVPRVQDLRRQPQQNKGGGRHLAAQPGTLHLSMLGTFRAISVVRC